MKPSPNQIEEILERTPRVLSALLLDLGSDWIDAHEGPGTWSPREVVAHMLDLEGFAWVDRARHLLEHGPDKAFEPVDRSRFTGVGVAELPISELLSRFAHLRRENLLAVDDLELDDEKLSREGTHPALGPVRLSELMATWCVHDLTHLAQITRVMARRLETQVGPWSAYLSVLTWRGSAGS